MKRILLGAAVAAICAFGGSAAMAAADGTAYLAQCKANIAAETPPPGSTITNEQRLGLCQCVVDSGDQKVVDEGLAMAKLPRDERFAKFSTASDAYKAAIDACRKKLNLPAPPAPPAAPK